ncbi:uncharacterized protein RMCB_0563 [Mycolicibacterium brisbanense]|uniref:Transmembrane protein n=2 Tax=Mycolicibacterium brisbanense TaxID=146020 RepID=A0A100VUV1_9MYCO|nr:uncharacterized protein RMCB_0563 [Mycolicibacterium brisbanense]
METLGVDSDAQGLSSKRATAMTDDILSDTEIAAMTAAQRRELIQRLERPLEELQPRGLPARLKQAHLGLMTGGAIFMIPWIVYLSVTLPENYTVRDWPLTWVGFDSVLVFFMAATAILTWMHRQVLVFPAFTTGILLLCDAWFDITTAGPGDMFASVLTAVLGGALAFVLIAGSVSLVRVNARRLWMLDHGQPLWRLPLFS